MGGDPEATMDDPVWMPCPSVISHSRTNSVALSPDRDVGFNDIRCVEAVLVEIGAVGKLTGVVAGVVSSGSVAAGVVSTENHDAGVVVVQRGQGIICINVIQLAEEAVGSRLEGSAVHGVVLPLNGEMVVGHPGPIALVDDV